MKFFTTALAITLSIAEALMRRKMLETISGAGPSLLSPAPKIKLNTNIMTPMPPHIYINFHCCFDKTVKTTPKTQNEKQMIAVTLEKDIAPGSLSALKISPLNTAPVVANVVIEAISTKRLINPITPNKPSLIQLVMLGERFIKEPEEPAAPY